MARSKPRQGKSAPPIHAAITGGGMFDLAEHLGQWVVVYFFPRSNTPG